MCSLQELQRCQVKARKKPCLEQSHETSLAWPPLQNILSFLCLCVRALLQVIACQVGSVCAISQIMLFCKKERLCSAPTCFKRNIKKTQDRPPQRNWARATTQPTSKPPSSPECHWAMLCGVKGCTFEVCPWLDETGDFLACLAFLRASCEYLDSYKFRSVEGPGPSNLQSPAGSEFSALYSQAATFSWTVPQALANCTDSSSSEQAKLCASDLKFPGSAGQYLRFVPFPYQKKMHCCWTSLNKTMAEQHNWSSEDNSCGSFGSWGWPSATLAAFASSMFRRHLLVPLVSFRWCLITQEGGTVWCAMPQKKFHLGPRTWEKGGARKHM